WANSVTLGPLPGGPPHGCRRPGILRRPVANIRRAGGELAVLLGNLRPERRRANFSPVRGWERANRPPPRWAAGEPPGRSAPVREPCRTRGECAAGAPADELRASQGLVARKRRATVLSAEAPSWPIASGLVARQ